jgi:2C-methyl-D-erythritol 2,4-cyclodiphosphate synthase
MGGGPTISGGMSQAEYQQLLMEQRRYAEEADAKREAKLKEYEIQRTQAEKSLLDAQKIAEQQKITSQQDAEAQIAAELEAAQQQEEMKKGSMETLGSSFYDSLYQGLYGTSGSEQRPQ